jgi:hypothetical protein
MCKLVELGVIRSAATGDFAEESAGQQASRPEKFANAALPAGRHVA